MRSTVAAFPLLVSLALVAAVRADDEPVSETPEFREWNGSWEIADEANRLLGYATEEDRIDASSMHPLSFRLRVHESPAIQLPEQEVQEVQRGLLDRIDHLIVASADWTATFENDDEYGPRAFVTRRDGKVFLLGLVPYAVFNGGEVSFVRGRDREHDLLVIDFNSSGNAGEDRIANTVAYRRQPLHSGFAEGSYTGASQLMQIAEDGTISFDDNPMGICHLDVTDEDRLRVGFPDPELGRGRTRVRTLDLVAAEPRLTWERQSEDVTYRATATPFSPKAYVVRIEVIRDDKVIAGSQQFFALDRTVTEEAAAAEEVESPEPIKTFGN